MADTHTTGLPGWPAPEPIPLTQPVRIAAPVPLDQKSQLHETRRQMFAGQALQALLMHNGANASEANLSRMAQLAVRSADLLLIELEKPAK